MGSKEQGNTDKSSKSCMCVVELSSPRIVLSVIYYGCLIPAIIFPFIFLVIVLSAMIGSVFCGMREGVRMGLGFSVLKKTSLFITKLTEGSDWIIESTNYLIFSISPPLLFFEFTLLTIYLYGLLCHTTYCFSSVATYSLSCSQRTINRLA